MGWKVLALARARSTLVPRSARHSLALARARKPLTRPRSQKRKILRTGGERRRWRGRFKPFRFLSHFFKMPKKNLPRHSPASSFFLFCSLSPLPQPTRFALRAKTRRFRQRRGRARGKKRKQLVSAGWLFAD